MGIDFGAIIRRSFEIAWKYKSLWIFGLFTGGASYFNISFQKCLPKEYGDSFDPRNLAGLEDFLREHLWEIVIAAGLWLGLLAIISIVCHLISIPAIVDAVNKITRGGTYRFADSFSRGLDFFWRFAGLFVLAFGCWVAVAFIVIMGIIMSPFTLILTIPGMLALAVVIYHVLALGGVAIVARDTDLGAGLEEGWTLLKANFGNVLLITLLYIAMAIGFGIVFGLLSMMAFWPIGVFVSVLTDSVWPAIFLGLLIGLPISVVLGGFQGTFFSSLYAQFYFQLVEPTPRPGMAGGGSPYPPAAPPTGPTV